MRKQFEEIYRATIHDVYQDIIEQFFHNKKFFNDTKPWTTKDGPR